MPGVLIPPAGGGSVDLTAVQELIDASVVDPASAPVVVDLSDRVTTLEDADVAKTKFRGVWATDDVLWQQDFSSGVIGPLWTAGASGSVTVPTLAPEAMASTAGASKPAYTTTLRIYPATSGSTGSYTQAVLDLSSIPELQGLSLSRVKFYQSQRRNTYAFSMEVRQGASALLRGSIGTVAVTTAAAWSQSNFVLGPATDSLIFRLVSGSSSAPGTTASQWNITGIQIYGGPAPYMFGDFVAYNNKMWRSETDNNASTPGVDASWTEIPLSGV